MAQPREVNYRAVLSGQENILKLMQGAAPLSEIFAEVVRTLEAAVDRTVIGALMTVEPGPNRLRHGAAPSLPADYCSAVDGIAVGHYGTCCAAAFLNEIVVTTDIENDPGWAKLKSLPLALGLKAAWSSPIRSRDGKVIGTLGTYFRECRSPSPAEVEVVTLLARTAALAIERMQR